VGAWSKPSAPPRRANSACRPNGRSSGFPWPVTRFDSCWSPNARQMAWWVERSRICGDSPASERRSSSSSRVKSNRVVSRTERQAANPADRPGCDLRSPAGQPVPDLLPRRIRGRRVFPWTCARDCPVRMGTGRDVGWRGRTRGAGPAERDGHRCPASAPSGTSAMAVSIEAAGDAPMPSLLVAVRVLYGRPSRPTPCYFFERESGTFRRPYGRRELQVEG